MDGETSDGQSSPSMWIVAGRYIICYLLWLVICALALWLVFQLRTNLVEDILFLRANPWVLRSIDRWALFVFGALWIVGIFLIEGHLRSGVERGRLWIRAGRILVIELVLIGLSFLINIIW